MSPGVAVPHYFMSEFEGVGDDDANDDGIDDRLLAAAGSAGGLLAEPRYDELRASAAFGSLLRVLRRTPRLLTVVDARGRGILHHAVRAGSAERQYAIACSLCLGYPGVWAMRPDADGVTPLHIALAKRDEVRTQSTCSR